MYKYRNHTIPWIKVKYYHPDSITAPQQKTSNHYRAIWRTTPSSSFEPDVLFHTPHGGLRPSFRLVCLKLSLFMWHWSCTSLTWWNLGQLAMRRASSLSCVLQTPPSASAVFLQQIDTRQTPHETKASMRQRVVLCVYISERWMAVGRSEVYLFPPPDGWWLIMWQCASPMSTALYSTSEIPLVFVEPPARNKMPYSSYLASLRASPNIILLYLRFRSCISFTHSSVSVKHSFLARLNWALLLFIHISELFNDS